MIVSAKFESLGDSFTACLNFSVYNFGRCLLHCPITLVYETDGLQIWGPPEQQEERWHVIKQLLSTKTDEMSEKEEPSKLLKSQVPLLGYWGGAFNSLLKTDTIRSDDGCSSILCDFTSSECIPIFDISFSWPCNVYYRFCMRVFCMFQCLMYREYTNSEQRDFDGFDDVLSASDEQVNAEDNKGIGSIQAYKATSGRSSRCSCNQHVAAIRNRKKRKVKGRTRSKVPRVLASMVFVLCVPCTDSSPEYPVRSFSTLSTYQCNRVTFRYKRPCPVPSLFGALIDHCHFHCDKGMQPNCIPMEPGSIYICLKAGEEVPAGYMWEAILDDNELSRLYIIQKECPPNFFQSEPSKPTDSVKACRHEHANLDNLAAEFEVSKMGNISSPTTVHCNFNKGFFNQDNKSEFNYDLNVIGSLASAFCIHTSFYNPCSKGEMILHNGTCVESCANGFYRDYHSNFVCKMRDDLSRPISVQQLSVSSFSSVTTIKSTTSETWPSTKQSGEKNSENSTDAHVKIVAAVVILILLILLVSIACLGYRRNKEDKKNRREDDAEAFKDGADSNEDVCENEDNVNGDSTEAVDEKGKEESKRRKKKQVIRKRTGNEVISRINNGNIQQNQNCSVHNYYHLCPSKKDKENLLNPTDEIKMTRLKTIQFEEQSLDGTTHKTMRKSCEFPASRANIVSECPADVSLVDISSRQSPLDGGHGQQISELNSEIDSNRKCQGRVSQEEDKRSINDTVEVSEQDQFNFFDAEDGQTVTDSDGNHENESEDDYPRGISTATEMNTTFCEDDSQDKGDKIKRRSDAKGDQTGRYLTAQGSLASNDASSDEADERSSLLEVAELRENYIHLGKTEMMSTDPIFSAARSRESSVFRLNFMEVLGASTPVSSQKAL